MAILKAEIDHPVTLAVTKMERVQGKFGPQIALHAGQDTFFMSPESYKRQFDALGVSDPTGLTFEFSKVPLDGNKTAINIKQVSGHATSGPVGKAQPFDQPAAPVSTSASDAYAHPASPAGQGATASMLRAHEWALQHIAPLYVAKGIPLSMDALADCAHSLFIQATR